MNRPIAMSGSKYQATMSASVLRVILNHRSVKDHIADLGRTDLSHRSSHLANGMGQKEDALLRRIAHSIQNVCKV